jgi:hypothetical protein
MYFGGGAMHQGGGYYGASSSCISHDDGKERGVWSTLAMEGGICWYVWVKGGSRLIEC